MSDPWNKNALGYGKNKEKINEPISNQKSSKNKTKKDKDPWNKNAMGYGLKTK